MSYGVTIQKCQEALVKSGRPLSTLKVLAVSKLQPIEKIQVLYQKGHRTFAENYVQEALAKQEALKALEIEWHLIGSLQKNKVKSVLGKFALIHSVDSLRLVEAVSLQASKLNLSQKILLQVNVAKEESKGGFSKEELFQLWPQIQKLPNISIEGLMTMPPLTENPESVRPFFRELREFKEHLQKQPSQHSLKELSMGTSHDFYVAIEEGATIVRLGTVLFGERAQHRTQK